MPLLLGGTQPCPPSIRERPAPNRSWPASVPPPPEALAHARTAIEADGTKPDDLTADFILMTDGGAAPSTLLLFRPAGRRRLSKNSPEPHSEDASVAPALTDSDATRSNESPATPGNGGDSFMPAAFAIAAIRIAAWYPGWRLIGTMFGSPALATAVRASVFIHPDVLTGSSLSSMTNGDFHSPHRTLIMRARRAGHVAIGARNSVPSVAVSVTADDGPSGTAPNSGTPDSRRRRPGMPPKELTVYSRTRARGTGGSSTNAAATLALNLGVARWRPGGTPAKPTGPILGSAGGRSMAGRRVCCGPRGIQMVPSCAGPRRYR